MAGGIDPDAPYLFNTRHAKPVEYQRRAPTLEELLQRQDFPFQILQPIPLRGVNINGLLPKTIEQLGFNYFVVIDNSNYTKMSDIYRDSRLAGKSNFVTSDSVVHPYLAFTNRVLTDATLTQIVPDMLLLLDSMQTASLLDYRNAEDAEVRADIERNIAYLAVAIKLLNPKYQLPDIGTAAGLAEADLKHIFAGRQARSAIFDRTEDFSQFKPTGFYNAHGGLQSYFRCREWLSRVPYPIIDISAGADGTINNNFRRSVLLYRSLDHGVALGKPAMELWTKLVKASSLLGTQLDNLKERTLYPQDYKYVFQGRSSDLRVTLNSLAEPLFRTKLMLAIRKQKPVNLSSASIFELEDGAVDGQTAANFRLFPVFAQPEQPWLRVIARNFPTDKQSSSAWPVSLMDMYAWGSPIAGNILHDNVHALDPSLSKVLPELVNCIMRRQPGGQMQPVDSRTWKFLSTYFKPLPEGVPAVLRSEFWMCRRLLSAFGGWVDSQCAMAPAEAPVANASTNSAKATASTEAPTGDSVSGVPTAANPTMVPRRMGKGAPYHYLEPTIELYRLLEQDATKIQADLVASNYFPDRYKTRFGDFTRLFQRFQKISEAELRNQQLSQVDKRLLGTIDQILEKVDVPLPSVLPIEAPSEDRFGRGVNLAVGRPGQLYIIYQNPHTLEWTLGRGAVYTYYELPAPLLTDSMWQHKLEAGFAQPLQWASRFQVVQKEEKKAATAARP